VFGLFIVFASLFTLDIFCKRVKLFNDSALQKDVSELEKLDDDSFQNADSMIFS
jgi:hypothetical protein